MKLPYIVACAVVASLFLSVSASAQFPGGNRGGPGGSGSRDGMRQEPRLSRESVPRAERASPGATTQAQLDALEDDLRLTEAQRPLWYAYADQVQKLGDTMSRLRFEARTGSGPSGGTTPEQLDRIADEERRRATTIDQIVASAKALYAVLAPEQRRIADARFASPVLDLTFGGLSMRNEDLGSVTTRSRR